LSGERWSAACTASMRRSQNRAASISCASAAQAFGLLAGCIPDASKQ
jgi:hypothetical protein